jgi:hypothetical protein
VERESGGGDHPDQQGREFVIAAEYPGSSCRAETCGILREKGLTTGAGPARPTRGPRGAGGDQAASKCCGARSAGPRGRPVPWTRRR